MGDGEGVFPARRATGVGERVLRVKAARSGDGPGGTRVLVFVPGKGAGFEAAVFDDGGVAGAG